MWGESFAASPIAIQMQACTQWTHSDVWSQLATTPDCLFNIGERLCEKKRWNGDQRAICNLTHCIDAGRGVFHHRSVSDGSDRLRPLWHRHSVRTEMFFANAFQRHCSTLGILDHGWYKSYGLKQDWPYPLEIKERIKKLLCIFSG
jgi:hypothetical protein